jgi:hypothetical protein
MKKIIKKKIGWLLYCFNASRMPRFFSSYIVTSAAGEVDDLSGAPDLRPLLRLSAKKRGSAAPAERRVSTPRPVSSWEIRAARGGCAAGMYTQHQHNSSTMYVSSRQLQPFLMRYYNHHRSVHAACVCAFVVR